jgi:tRNA nucleotidyltransferase (CCA-adding enzyme)
MNIAKKIEAALPDKTLAFVRGLGVKAASRKCRAYLVGGTVRDIFLGKGHIDVDVAVEGDAIKLGKMVAKETGSDIVTYKSFGTCTLSFEDGIKLDLATARREVYKRPGAMPIIKPSTLKEDLKRRDFTINAIAVSIMPGDFGKMHDPFNGIGDIRSGVIRSLHSRSFIDDPTRILRARRFAARFGFKIEVKTDELMKKALINKALDTVSAGRIQKELLLISKEIL